ncbi:MAG: cysteine--tRNA ligase [Defluviitaleaceae bacterium]|nr:cysteine--tRNA ligase [Defluviitaleaceae bacterium]
MKLYCTLTRTKRPFVPVNPGKAGIYVCGPTVHNFAHIGNFRPHVVFDVLHRFLEYTGYDVNLVQNFTDIDDKIIKRANEQSVSFLDIANTYIHEFFTDMEGFNIRPAAHFPRVSQEIPDIIALVQHLIDKGFAYDVDGTVYFRAPKADNYGKLSKKNIDDLEAGARVEINSDKSHPSDFVLWKAAKPGEPNWDSPWGPGRPGWHIECSVMARKYIGQTIDIHCGGEDLIFPHHENEIAQSEAQSDTPFVNYWLHNGMLLFDNQKMSKSAGNSFLVRDIVQKFPYPVLRFFILSVHYRSPLNFSEELLAAAQSGLERIKNCKRTFLEKFPSAQPVNNPEITEIPRFRQDFEAALSDDLNTANAITAIFELVKFANKTTNTAGRNFIQLVLDEINFMCDILGILLDADNTNTDTAEIENLIAQRNAAKAAKNFALADEIRNTLTARNVTIKDTREGTTWHFNN